MAFTVTATESGSSAQHGVALLVRVLTGAVEAGGATSGNDSTGGATAQGSLTPAGSNSYVAFSVSGDNVTTMPAAATNNTYDLTTGNPADLWSTAQGHYTGTVTAGTPLTYGAGSAGAQDHSNWCAYEIQSSGGSTPAVDGSSPAGALSGSNLTSGTAATTASFTPPVGSVLVAQIAAGGSGSGTGITITMSDTSGLGLVWTRRAVSNTSDNFQPTFIFTATVGAGSPGILAQPWRQRGSKNYRHRWHRPQQVMPEPFFTPATVATAGVATVAAAGIDGNFKPYVAALAGTGYNSYFTDQYGTPRLMLLEQAWALPWNAGRWSGSGGGATPQADYTSYFSTRASQGYTSWYGIAWGNSHVDSTALSGGRTWDGIYPLIVNGTAGAIATGSETISLNSSFWSRIDAFFNTARNYGITCFLNLSMSYDVTDVGGIWQHATNTQAGAFGAALAARYPQSMYPNVQWFWGDDDDGPNDSFYQAMLTGIQGAGDTRSLISIEQFTNTNCHIEFDNKTGFSGTFGKPNATYNWVYSYDVPYFGVEDSYTEGGTFTHIPPIYGDGAYYGDSASGTTTDRVMRNYAWWALASGARGFPATSGPSDLGGGGLWSWQSDAVSRLTSDPNGNGTFTTTVAGAIRSFIEGLTDWQKLIPDTGNVLITAGRGTRGTCDAPGGVFDFRNTNAYVAGSITPTGTLAVIYCKAAMSITIDQTQLSSGYTATWVDPVSLATTSTTTGSTYSSSGLGNNSAGDPDWVLVLQGAPAVTATAGVATVAAVAPGASAAETATAGVPTVLAAAPAAVAAETVTAGAPVVLAADPGATVSASGGTNATAGVAAVHAAAQLPAVAATGTFRLMDGLSGRPGNGPAVSAYSGNFLAGILWKVTENGLWLDGYWHWVPTGGDTGSRKFALWQLTDTTHSVSQQLVPNSTVTSGTLTAGQWNYVPLATPIGLSGNVPYVACYGYVAVNGFPDTQNQFGAGDTYAAGITNGPLFAYSDQGASAPEPFTSNYNQGVFSTAGSDPAAIMPATGDVHSNFWIDVQIDTAPPPGASYRLWPSQPYAVNWVNDTANNFTLACEFTLSQACALDNIWFYSAAGMTQLPTECGIWNVTTQALVSGTDNASPSWSGAAGSGWVSVSYTGVTLPPGDYKVAVVNSAGTPAIWNPTTNDYWDIGPGGSGITNGPLTALDTAHATSPGQDTYNAGATFVYPLTYSTPADGANYWVDAEVTPAGGAVTATAGVAAVAAAAPAASAAETATAGVGTILTVARPPAAAESITAAAATVLAAAAQASIAETVTAGAGVINAVATQATVNTSGSTNATAGVAAIRALAVSPTTAVAFSAGAAAAQALVSAPVAAPAAFAGAGTVLAAGTAATISTIGGTVANAAAATVAAIARAPGVSVAAVAQAAIVLAVSPQVPPPFIPGFLTAADSPLAVLTATDQRAGGPE